MNDARRERLKEALLVLESLPADQRGAWARRRLADDPELRDEVLSLLSATDPGSDHLLDPLVVPPESLHALRPMPETIGPYTIAGILGQGGMSNVYRATQTSPIRRTVAIKVLKPGVAPHALLARFEAERQTIARLEHRNIARLLDAGADAHGRPYLAMELIDGPSITEYVQLHRLRLRDRLELFVQVCRGVQHAHNRGILHRDLKPSNILVAEEDTFAVPKVIDFGVAKLLEPDPDLPRATLSGQILGTVEYMSPEQADPVNPVADVRSDVYSLGVLLFELLTDVLPFPETQLRAKSATQLYEFLRNARPEAPSQRLAALRRSAGALIPVEQIPAELDCITLKAIERDPDRRYASAGDFANDIERFLRREVVHARPPTTAYIARKFVERNRVPVLAASVVASALLASVVIMFIGLRQAVTRRDAAERERQKAQEAVNEATKQRDAANAERARAQKAAADFDEVASRIRMHVLTPRLGPNATITQVVARGADDYFQRPPQSVTVRARVAQTLGQSLFHAGDYPRAQRLLEEARACFTSPDFDAINAPQRDDMLFLTLCQLAAIERNTHGDGSAIKSWAEAVRAGAAMPNLSHDQYLTAKVSYGDVLAATGRFDAALETMRDVRKRAVALNARPEVLALYDTAISGALGRLERFDEAIELGTAAYEVRRQIGQSSAFTIMSGLKLGQTMLRTGRAEQALAKFHEVVALCESTFGADQYETRLARAMASQAALRVAPSDEELARLRDAVARAEQVDAATPGRVKSMRMLLVDGLIAAGRLEEAAALSELVAADLARQFGEQSDDLAMLRWDLARHWMRTPRREPALGLLLKAEATLMHTLDQRESARTLIARDIALLTADAPAAAGQESERNP